MSDDDNSHLAEKNAILRTAINARDARITALEAELAAALANKAKLREAVEPFAECIAVDNGDVSLINTPTLDNYFRARRAYEETA